MKQMLQEVMTAPGQIEFREVPVPEPGPGEVLLRVMKIGICGSDIHVWHGTHPYTGYPVTQGHEVSCVVEQLGSGVTDLHAGEKVTVQPQIFCGKCYPCTHGRYNLCEHLKVMGFQAPGLASTYFAVDQSKICPLPEEMTFDQGAMIEPLAVAVHAARRYPGLSGAKVCIIGAGPIGILTSQAVKALGAASVMVTDISDFRVRKALECGADCGFNTKDQDFGKCLTEAFGSDKADVIYDCAGNDISMGEAIREARKGSTIILVAVFAKKASVDLAMLNDHELDLNTSMMYRREDFEEAIRLVTDKKVVLEPLMSRVYPFRQYAEAYRFIDGNREQTMKVLIDVQA